MCLQFTGKHPIKTAEEDIEILKRVKLIAGRYGDPIFVSEIREYKFEVLEPEVKLEPMSLMSRSEVAKYNSRYYLSQDLIKRVTSYWDAQSISTVSEEAFISKEPIFEIQKGYHSFRKGSDAAVHCRLFKDKKHMKNIQYTSVFRTIRSGGAVRAVIHGVIPKGSEYTETDYGLMVSSNISLDLGTYYIL